MIGKAKLLWTVDELYYCGLWTVDELYNSLILIFRK